MDSSTTTLPQAPACIFLAGIGGIGMSGLAQLFRHMGYTVAGSDRALAEPHRQELFQQLRQQGIELYPQDGSGIVATSPAAVVLSAAVESTNPDWLAAKEKGVLILHRADAMNQLFRRIGAPLIAVAGSCGKTSTTGWIASALKQLGHSVLMLNGGMTLDFVNEKKHLPGNFHADEKPEFIVAEIDESDRSINLCQPDYGVVLNIGDDHYDAPELQRLFQSFLGRCHKGAVTSQELVDILPEGVPIRSFTTAAPDYIMDRGGAAFSVDNDLPIIHSRQSGRHSAWNCAAAAAVLRLVLPECPLAKLAAALEPFQGVVQRFEVLTPPHATTAIINDYAHNPEKIAAALRTAQERFGAPIAAVFQPHGYAPLGFMREALRQQLQSVLRPQDLFIMLPVYYAGGTSSFTPTSQEVAQHFADCGLPVLCAKDRQEAQQLLQSRQFRAWLIMGARDISLRTWSQQLL